MSGALKVFEDPSRLRWRLTSAVFALFVLFGFSLAALSISDLLINPPLPRIQQAERQRRHILATESTAFSPATGRVTRPASAPARRLADVGAPGLARLPRKGAQLLLGFLVQSDPRSLAAFEEQVSRLDVVVPDWFSLTGPTAKVAADIDPAVSARLRERGVAILPRVSNLAGDAWHTADFAALLRTDTARREAAQTLAEHAVRLGVDGLNLDFEMLGPEDSVPLLEFIQFVAAALHQRGKLLTVDVAANDPAYDLEAIGEAADGVVLMAYDEHYPGGAPGPVAGESWFEDSVDNLAQAVAPEKLVVAVGNYAYDWTVGSRAPAQVLSYAEVMALADDLDVEPELGGAERNPHFGYQDDQRRPHEVWFLDMLSAWNEAHLARSRHVAGLALWRLGTEAPLTWEVLSGEITSAAQLKTAPALHTIDYPSAGELLRIKSLPRPAPIELTLDGELIDFARYLDTPTGYAVTRVGAEMPPRTLVLTFDDGPDPVWTPQVLLLLKRLQVPAVFFVVGDQAMRYPELVRAESAQGFLVGNHTYLHPNIAAISPARLRAELNSTQRLIEALTGHRALLFRAPYDTDSAPSDAHQLEVLSSVNDLGYVIAGANIDGGDWERPGTDAIVRAVERQAAEPANHVIVLHDAGGERSQTLAAVARFVPELRARGYRFESLEEASGIPRDLLAAPLPGSERLLVLGVDLLSAIGHYGWLAIVVLFALTTGLSLLRVVVLGTLVLYSVRRKDRHSAPAAPPPFISVLIPAYNEERVIAATLRSVLASAYPAFEVLVIDDGSTDRTAAAAGALAAQDPRVRVVTVPNAGKSEALNHGFRAVRAEIVVTIDADTLLHPETLAQLVEPFADPTVDAVCGNVEVGNIRNVLTAFQALEYITTQNFDRRAFELLNCITVVPGATGAWRRSRVLALGGYQPDTLTEDADITLRLLRAGGRVAYAVEARSQTEAPETVATLAQQRFRWSYGTFQCLWKHRGALGTGTLGWVGLPNMFLFQVLFPVLSPIGDLVFLISVLRGDFRALLSGYVLFLLMDLAGSLLAFTLERQPRRLMWLILVQRFFYRQFMYVVTFRALLAALRGRRHGWNKLARRGSVGVGNSPSC